MLQLHRFLIVDDNRDSRFLVVRALLRRFPDAVVHECESGDAAAMIAQGDPLSAIVAHRTFDAPGPVLAALLRRAAPAVPIVMVSGVDRTAESLEAGANAFLRYDEWIQIGAVVAEVMAGAETTVVRP